MDTLHFLLTPDRSSARCLRRLAAEKGGRLGVVVGTWPELVEQARKAYLLPAPDSLWNEKLAEAAGGIKDAFWAASLEAAGDETLASIGRALTLLVEGIGPIGKIGPDRDSVLPERARKHLSDLAVLHKAMDGALPPHIGIIQDVLDADPSFALRELAVYRQEGMPRLSLWQKALLDKLAQDSSNKRDKDLEHMMADAFASAAPKSRPAGLAALQNSLFLADSKAVQRDDSVQWLGARDYLEEVEILAGMIQKALKEDKKLKAPDIGILVPSDHGYVTALNNVFSPAGLPLSGLNPERPVRDLGREAVLFFLLCRRKPAPAMALAALLTSPLMPWSSERGMAFARQVMRGEYRFDPEKLEPVARRMMSLIRQDSEKPGDLADSVERFIDLLSVPKDMEEHRGHAREAADRVIAALRRVKGELPWNEIISLSSPQSLHGSGTQALFREGIAVFEEDEEPWRNVRKLFVLGFEYGRYPSKPGRSAVFSEEDLLILKTKLGYDIETGAEATSRRRELFRRQLGAADRDVTFLVPRRDTAGKPLQPSESLTFMARLFKGVHDPQNLLLDLDTEAGRASARGLSIAPRKKPLRPRALKVDDLHIGQDLLQLRKNRDGSPKPESPSFIETLIISPLGWFLERNGLVPSDWCCEELDPASKGTLAHEVFENLFAPGRALPDDKAIRKDVPGLLNSAVVRIKPMLLAKEWRIEYQHLEKEIETAAVQWRNFLNEIGAEVIGTEVELFGTLDRLPLHGKTDLLISLPGGRMFVVDYKKSKSKKRRNQMDKGWDSQTSLYRVMLKTGGVKDKTRKDIATAIKSAKDVGVLYYMMNDQMILADTARWIGRDIAGVEEMGPNISRFAMEQIRKRIDELQKGILILNYENDGKTIEKETGMTAKYALEKSPLIQLFMKEEDPA